MKFSLRGLEGPMQSIKHEVARAVYTMLQALTVFRDRKPLTEPADRAGHRFNTLLGRARYSFPASRAIASLQPLEADARLATVLTRLSALKGAIDTELIRVGEAAGSVRHTSSGDILRVASTRSSCSTASCGDVAACR